MLERTSVMRLQRSSDRQAQYYLSVYSSTSRQESLAEVLCLTEIIQHKGSRR